MSVTLTAEQFNLLPLHDAEILSWLFEYDETENLLLRLRIEINPEESIDSFVSLGIDTRLVELAFTIRNADCQFQGMFTPPVFLLDYDATTGPECHVELGCNSGTRLSASVSSIRIKSTQ